MPLLFYSLMKESKYDGVIEINRHPYCLGFGPYVLLFDTYQTVAQKTTI
jgi:hypothetical protein